jgi:hypothetical protein
LLYGGSPAAVREFRLQLPGTTPEGFTIDYTSNRWLSLIEVSNLPTFAHYIHLRPFVPRGPAVVTTDVGPPRLGMRITFVAFIVASATVAALAWRRQSKH